MSSVEIIFRPLNGLWPSDGKTEYENCRFRAAYSRTISELKYELGRLGAGRAVIELDLTEGDIRRDNMPRANARPELPRVRVSFDHPSLGSLQYPCDTYANWQDNLRGIVKTLEAQRAQERYGATRQHQQYAGWQQLPPGSGESMQAAMTVEQAAKFVCDHDAYSDTTDDVLNSAETFRDCYRSAAAKLHPDICGQDDQFKTLQEAKRVLDSYHHGAAQ